MAPAGQISMQARQPVQRAATTSGRRGAGSSARSGHVAMHIPHAVQRSSITTVVTGHTPAV
jgi:hypothetical protein